MKIVNVATETLRHRWGNTTRDSVILKIESDNGLIGISRGGDPDIMPPDESDNNSSNGEPSYFPYDRKH